MAQARSGQKCLARNGGQACGGCSFGCNARRVAPEPRTGGPHARGTRDRSGGNTGMNMQRTSIAASALLLLAQAASAATVAGTVVDHNGTPVKEAQLVLTRASGSVGAQVVTVFSG